MTLHQVCQISRNYTIVVLARWRGWSRTTQNRSRTSSNWSYYAKSISYFVKSVVLRRIDLVHRRIDVLLRIDLVLVKSITECCSQSNETFLRMWRNTRRCQLTLYACISEDRVKAPRVTFVATYDLSTGSPRIKIYKKRNPRKSGREAKNPRAGAKPGFKCVPTYSN